MTVPGIAPARPDIGGGHADFPTELFTITGEPSAISSAASAYRTFGAAAGEVGPAVGSRTLPSWSGAEGDLYRSRVGGYPPLMSSASSVFAGIARELDSFAQTMQAQQQAMSSLRAHALDIWQQVQQARAALSTAQAGLASARSSPAMAPAQGTAAQPQVTAAQGAVTAASNRVSGLEAQWETCCRQARWIHDAMKEAAPVASSRVRALESPGAVPPPAAGGASGAAMFPRQWGGPSPTPEPAIPTTPGGATGPPPGTPQSAVTWLQGALKYPLLANSWYSVYGAPGELFNAPIDNRAKLFPHIANRLPTSRWPTVNTLDQNAKGLATAASLDLDRARTAFAMAKGRIAEYSRVSREQPLNLWNDVKLLATKATMPYRTVDVKSAALLDGLAKGASGVTGAARGAARVLGPVDSLITLVNPTSKGGLQVADRAMAGTNLLGTAATEAAPLISKAVPLLTRAAPWAARGLTFVPGVGQVVAAGTGVYLTGRWLYDNYDPAKKSFDAVGDFAKDAGSALVHGDLDKVGQEAKEFASTLGQQGQRVVEDVKNLDDKAVELGRKAWDGIKSIF